MLSCRPGGERESTPASCSVASEYFLYDPRSRKLEGFRLAAPGGYRPLVPDGEGRLWSEQLGVSLGLWHGTWDGREDDWLRLFHSDGSLVPTKDEAAEQRAELAEAELARLRALLEERDAG